MNASYTSTLTQLPLTPYHGVTALAYSQAMDVETDGQRLPDRNQENDIMDTTLDGVHHIADKGKAPETQVDESTSSVKVEPASSTPTSQVLERPREGGDDGVREAPTQMPVIPQPQHPPLTANLFSLYGLQPLVATVARQDPVTGEKINRLRKSYEGHLKTMGLSGKNKAVKHEPAKGMSLKELTTWPEEEWQNQKVAGKDVHQGLPAEIVAKLDKAMQMQPGPVPNNEHWEGELGHEKIRPVDPKVLKIAHKAPAAVKSNGQVNGTSANAEAIRPKRTGRKRRYDEHSFEGYGEGFVDDELDLGGYSSGDTQISRRSSTNKKRKKDYATSPTGFGDRTGSFNSGMVGVPAYGR